MKLSSSWLYEQLKKEYEIVESGGLSGGDRFSRPFLYSRTFHGGQDRVCILSETSLEAFSLQQDWNGLDRFSDPAAMAGQVCLVICTKNTKPEEKHYENLLAGIPWIFVKISCDEDMAEVLNYVQQVFDLCEEWETQIRHLLMEDGSIEKIIKEASEFLENPLLVMSLDFSLIAEYGSEQLPERARLFNNDSVNMEYVSALIQDENYQKLSETRETVLFPAYLSGKRSLNRNLCTDGKPTHRLVLTECSRPVTAGDICIMESLVEGLEYLLSQEAGTPVTGDMEVIFEKILSDRTADYMLMSRQLSALGWGSEHYYLCLILQITYLNQKQLSTRAICRYLMKTFPDSVSFLYRDEVVTFFNLTRAGMTEEDVQTKLIYFIRDSYLKAGYSRAVQGHMYLRRQYIQAKVALDVGGRKRPYLWIHYFNQVVLTYILEQITRRLPGAMLCHEGLLRLRDADEKNNSEYVKTLKVYLEQHLSATQASKEMFIHRSTFLYRLDKIKEILQSDLEDPDEIFYLELSLKLLEQEEEQREE